MPLRAGHDERQPRRVEHTADKFLFNLRAAGDEQCLNAAPSAGLFGESTLPSMFRAKNGSPPPRDLHAALKPVDVPCRVRRLDLRFDDHAGTAAGQIFSAGTNFTGDGRDSSGTATPIGEQCLAGIRGFISKFDPAH